MQLVDLSKPGEKKKLHVGGRAGSRRHRGSLVGVHRFWQRHSDRHSATTAERRRRSEPHTDPQRTQSARRSPRSTGSRLTFTEIDLRSRSSYNAPEARRNIFAYYEPPRKHCCRLLRLRRRRRRHLRRCCWRRFLRRTFTLAPRISSWKLAGDKFTPADAHLC